MRAHLLSQTRLEQLMGLEEEVDQTGVDGPIFVGLLLSRRLPSRRLPTEALQLLLLWLSLPAAAVLVGLQI